MKSARGSAFSALFCLSSAAFVLVSVPIASQSSQPDRAVMGQPRAPKVPGARPKPRPAPLPDDGAGGGGGGGNQPQNDNGGGGGGWNPDGEDPIEQPGGGGTINPGGGGVVVGDPCKPQFLGGDRELSVICVAPGGTGVGGAQVINSLGCDIQWTSTCGDVQTDPTNRIAWVEVSLGEDCTLTATFVNCPCAGASRTIRFRGVGVRLDMDNDNNNETDPPDCGPAERAAKNMNEPKLFTIATGDSDEDYIPDFAEGTNLWPEQETRSIGLGGGELIPVIVDISGFPLSATSEITIEYDGSDPASMTRTLSGAGWHTYELGTQTGSTRLWTTRSRVRKVAGVKQGGDYIKPDTYTPAQLGLTGGTATWYVEGVRRGSGNINILVSRCQLDLDVSCGDSTLAEGFDLRFDDARVFGPGMSSLTNRDAATPVLTNGSWFWEPPGGVDPSMPVGGAVTDGASPVLVRVNAGGLKPTDEIVVMHHASGLGENPAAYGGFSEIDAGPGGEAGPGPRPPLSLPKLPYTGEDGAVQGKRTLVKKAAMYIPPDEYADSRFASGGAALNDMPSAVMRFELRRAGKVLGKATNFRLRRPPLVLVHGLGSSPATWKASVWTEFSSASPPPRGIPTRLHKLDYSATATDGYDMNWFRVAKCVDDAISEYRTASDGSTHVASVGFYGVRYAATRVDVVAHSMGGILTRLYISDVECSPIPRANGGSTTPPIYMVRSDTGSDGRWHYLRPSNYGAGSIRRFVTLGTPFDGAGIAAAGRAVNSGKKGYQFSKEMLIATWEDRDPDPRNLSLPPPQIALFDLEPGSTFQLMMDMAVTFPTAHKRALWKPMVGVVNRDVDPTILQSIQWFGVSWVTGNMPNIEEFDPTRGDFAVLKESAANGQLNQMVATIWTNTTHSEYPELDGLGVVGEPYRREIRDFIENIIYQDNKTVWQGSIK